MREGTATLGAMAAHGYRIFSRMGHEGIPDGRKTARHRKENSGGELKASFDHRITVSAVATEFVSGTRTWDCDVRVVFRSAPGMGPAFAMERGRERTG